MKRFYSLLTAIVLVFVFNVSFGQFYDGFTGTGNIGGDCSDATCSNNGWFTHSNSKPAVIEIKSGSLSYSGLQASTGNRVAITGSADLSRDINAAVTVVGDVVYVSALINIVDATNIGESGAYNYFLHLAAQTGNVDVTSFYTRLGITQSNSGANFRFGIMNASGGAYEPFTTDLTFGQTYLVVMKYVKSTNTSYLWVNPTLSAVEAAGSITYSNGTAAPDIKAVCIRNGYSAGPPAAGTPKAEIDEIRVGDSWTSVLPLASSIQGVSFSNLAVYPNPVNDILNISEKANIKVINLAGQIVIDSKNVESVDMSKLNKGMYIINIEANGETRIQKVIKN